MAGSSESQRAAEQEIFAGAQDAGVRILGLTTSGVHETIVGSGDDGPVEIGERTTVTVRVAEDGTLLPRRENSDASTPPATSILEIDVVPSIELDANGDKQVVWTGYAKQYDVDTTNAIATSASSPQVVNPGSAAEQLSATPAEAVTKALTPMVSGGKMNIGAQESLPATSPEPEPATPPPATPESSAAEPVSLSTWVKRGVALAAVGGVIAGGTFLLTDDDDPTPATQGQTEVQDESADEPVQDELPQDQEDDAEDESPPTPTEAVITCADGLQPDDDGDGGGTGGGSADDDPQKAQANIVCSGSTKGSFVFTMVVDGDGEAMTQLENLLWYNPRFILNNDPETNVFFDDTGFAVDVNFSPRGVDASIFDASYSAIPASDYEATVDWTDSSTLVVTVTGFREDVSIVNSRIELVARLENADGTTANFEDRSLFTPES